MPWAAPLQDSLRGGTGESEKSIVAGMRPAIAAEKANHERRIAGDGMCYSQKEYAVKFASTDGWDSLEKMPRGDRPAWTIEESLGPALGAVIAKILRPQSAAADPEEELAFVRALGRVGNVAMVRTALEAEDALGKLSEAVFEFAQSIAAAEAATGEELNDKFLTSGGTFELAYGDRAIFFNGLEVRIGSPSPNILDGMINDHCLQVDSDKPWTTGNYGITTTAKTEFWLVAGEIIEEIKECTVVFPEEWLQLGRALEAHPSNIRPSWPPETKNTMHPRASCKASGIMRAALAKNAALREMGEHPLRIEEVLACRLYTGPLFEKYNAVHRGGSLVGEQSPFMVRRFRELCGADGTASVNRYTTTNHVLSSGIIKSSKLSKAETVYRGVSGGRLPKQFWVADELGTKGGVEFAFMSTTSNRDVAFQYASSGGAGMIFEIQMGMIDKGADLSWISQYPSERELCFPPLTGMEVVGSRVDGSILVVSIRLNLNLTCRTIDEIIGKRQGIVRDMCENFVLECEKEAWDLSHASDDGPPFRQFVLKQATERLQALEDGPASKFNDDRELLSTFEKAFAVKKGVAQARQMLACSRECDDADVFAIMDGLRALYSTQDEWEASLQGEVAVAYQCLKEAADMAQHKTAIRKRIRDLEPTLRYKDDDGKLLNDPQGEPLHKLDKNGENPRSGGRIICDMMREDACARPIAFDELKLAIREGLELTSLSGQEQPDMWDAAERHQRAAVLEIIGWGGEASWPFLRSAVEMMKACNGSKACSKESVKVVSLVVQTGLEALKRLQTQFAVPVFDLIDIEDIVAIINDKTWRGNAAFAIYSAPVIDEALELLNCAGPIVNGHIDGIIWVIGWRTEYSCDCHKLATEIVLRAPAEIGARHFDAIWAGVCHIGYSSNTPLAELLSRYPVELLPRLGSCFIQDSGSSSDFVRLLFAVSNHHGQAAAQHLEKVIPQLVNIIKGECGADTKELALSIMQFLGVEPSRYQ